MVKHLTFTILFALANAFVLAQDKKSVVIGTMISRPNAVLVINPPDKDQGFLLPQLTTAERLSINPASPQDNGLMVFDVTENAFYYWSGTGWIKGLGDINQALSYDAATQTLSLSGGGGTISLSVLKEIPSPAGQSGKYLTTDGTVLSWATLGAIGDITSVVAGSGLTGGATSGDINLSVNTDGTTIAVNGSNQLQLSDNAVTAPKIAANAVNSSHIADGSVSSADILDNTISTNDLLNAAVTGTKIANGAVGPAQLSSGGVNKVLTTDGAGVVGWADRSSFDDDNQNLALTGNTLSIDNGTSANLNNLNATGDVAGPLNNLVIQPDAVDGSMVTDGTLTTADIGSGGNNKVLITDGTGVVNWADRSTFDDDNQNLTFSGNTLSIDNGTGVNLSAGGQVTGLLDNLVIQSGAANQVLTTNAAGTATAWVTSAGDVTGAVGASTVARIQGRDVSNAVPNAGDALIWNGSAWVPTVITVSPATQFYAIDPSNFQAAEPGGNNQTILGLFQGDNTFVTAKGNGAQLIAPVNLPHNASIQDITVYYLNNDVLLLGTITVTLFRKSFAGANQQLTTATFGLSLVDTNAALPAIAVANRVVDNSLYSYRIVVTLTDSATSPSALDAVQRIYGIRIQYSK